MAPSAVPTIATVCCPVAVAVTDVNVVF